MAVKTKTKAAKAAKTPRDGGKTAAKTAQKDGNAPRTVRLGQFREDPDNVSVATDEEIARLAGKLKRVPLGLTAMRIAYVTDAPGGGCMVVSGNKRLRCLKAAYGDDGEVPAEWFQDITAMSEAERHEFRLNANISDGHFDLDKLLAQYDAAELSEAGLDELLAEVAEESGEEAAGLNDIYSKNIEAPQYEITGECPPVAELVDKTKADELSAEIDAAKDIPEEVRAFLKVAAMRHVVFDYRNIAEFYAHADAKTQRMMERSALVIIDYDDAVKNGFVKLSKTLEALRDECAEVTR